MKRSIIVTAIALMAPLVLSTSLVAWMVGTANSKASKANEAKTSQAELVEANKKRYARTCRDKPFWICPEAYDTDEDYQTAVKRAEESRERSIAHAKRQKEARQKREAIRNQLCQDLHDTDGIYISNGRVYVSDLTAFLLTSHTTKVNLVKGANICTGRAALYSHYTGRRLSW